MYDVMCSPASFPSSMICIFDILISIRRNFILHYLYNSSPVPLFPQHSEIKEKEAGMKRHEESEAKLTMQVTTLNENLGTVKKEWQSSQRRVSELEKQTDDLRGEIAVLEATVQNNQDERRALLER